MNKKGNAFVMIIIVVFAVVVIGAGAKYLMGDKLPWLSIGGEEEINVLDIPNYGESSTLDLNAYTGEWGKQGVKTEVFPVYTIIDSDGNVLVNDVNANTTTSTVGETVSLFGTGASRYVDPVQDVLITKERQTVEANAYTIAATSDLVISAYDSDENGLTADDNSNNTADYAGGDIAASDTQSYYIKLEQTGANVNYHLFGICTWIVGDEADDFELTQAGWKEVSVPELLDETSISMRDDTNASTSEKGFKHCYIPSNDEPIRLSENMDTGKIKFVFDSSDSVAPTANGDTYFGAVFLDGSYSVDKFGDIKYGFYMDDDTEDAGTVGIDENADTTWNGLDTAISIEPQ